jgi:hypothetical protein
MAAMKDKPANIADVGYIVLKDRDIGHLCGRPLDGWFRPTGLDGLKVRR